MEESVPVLFNTCYGGWHPSEKATALYNERNPGGTDNLYSIKCRHDPILVQIFRELGKEFDSAFARTAIKMIPAKYINYYTIREYDGMESIVINYHKYTLDSLKIVLNATDLSSDEKVRRFQEILGVWSNMRTIF